MDKDIILKILDGNISLFEDIISKYEKMVYNLSYRMFNNFSDAQDMTQEVFIKVYNNLEKCRDKDSIKSWIYTICYNTCIDEIRKRKGKNYISLDKEFESEEGSHFFDVKSEEETPEEAMVSKEGLNKIEQAINSLDEINRTLIYLKDIKGLKYEEISTITNLNIGTVKSKLNRARLKLRKLLN